VYDKPLHVKRDELVPGKDFYITICTNDLHTKYDIDAILELDEKTIQKSKFNRKGTNYSLFLN
jgi:hypothetical protein